MEIRQYRDSDFEGVVKLYKDRTSYGGEFDASRDTEERLLATSNSGNLYVAVSNHVVVGSVMILDNSHSFWLLRFAVDSAHQDAVAMLVEKMTDIAKSRGHQSILVYTDHKDKALNDRYAANGFIKSNVYRCYWKEVE